MEALGLQGGLSIGLLGLAESPGGLSEGLLGRQEGGRRPRRRAVGQPGGLSEELLDGQEACQESLWAAKRPRQAARRVQSQDRA